MIAKRINIEKGNDNSCRLGRYIADASHDGEKLLFAWHEGCLSETYEAALIEIEATQGMNQRCQGSKTYHLMVSFRPEDEPRLSRENIITIEKAFADALGFSGHQRMCGVHKNTNNLHMHIAYNMIHPEGFTKHEPFRDYFRLSEVCREMENRYNLVIDNGITHDQNKQPKINQRAASMEAHTGEKSFQSFTIEHKDVIVKALTDSKSWHEVHTALAEIGVKIVKRGNGLAIASADGRGAIKASALRRDFSKNRLTQRLGDYAPPKRSVPQREGYQREPIQPKTPEREALFQQYRSLREKRQLRLRASQQEYRSTKTRAFSQFSYQLQTLEKRILPRKTKRKLTQMLHLERRATMAELHETYERKIQKIREEIPFNTWNGYLKWKAEQGDRTALDVLRSKKLNATLDRLDQGMQKNSPETFAQSTHSMALSEKQIAAAGISGKHRSRLLAVTRMELLKAQEKINQGTNPTRPLIFSGTQHTIDNNGVVIFSLPSGGTIRDTGSKLYFSCDETTEQAAVMYGLARFGKNIHLRGNSIERKNNKHTTLLRTRTHQPNIARAQQNHQHSLRKLSELDVVRLGKKSKMLLQDNARRDMER
ncbi:relaxase/mobilization nuclease domain-containing protein [Desulfobulbus rhabdoformis]|uniref:TraI/MobA(P) family conjugative relaxase n=1 Tax=Desulfobulbus rhabdoformis TaxID=34032 RepID=UPI001962A88F|nr:TraI/MobA(P) family conjugative relaxase [Desulfobulbus rhabdoformis]MBM9616832.1 relaxase/mobilization nuclease domain-containing protein [Desulfobulbus rhabdoformis]